MPNDLRKHLVDLEIVDASKVVDYVYNTGTWRSFDTEEELLKTFCLLPIYNDFWMEATAPRTCYDLAADEVIDWLGDYQEIYESEREEGGATLQSFRPWKWGAVFQYTGRENFTADMWTIADDLVPDKTLQDTIKWHLHADLYTVHKTDVGFITYGGETPACWISLYINDEGEYIPDSLDYDTSFKLTHKDTGEEDDAFAKQFLLVFCQALTYMHCKNIHIVKQSGLNRHERRRRQKEIEHEAVPMPRVTYTILDVDPLYPKLQYPDGSPVRDIASIQRWMREHLVRGHRSDYTRGKGLFGKWKDRYFIRPHTRGNPTVGYSDHDYRVIHPVSPKTTAKLLR